jgi:hypothetical protein
MGYLSTFLSRSRVAFDRFRTALNRQSDRLFSMRRSDVASRLYGPKAQLKKRFLRLHHKLRSLPGKVAAKTAARSR